MQSRIEEIRATGTEVLAISVDSSEEVAKLAAAIEVDYPLLADPQLQAVDAFGLRHANGGPNGDISRPASYVVGPDGKVLWEDFTENYRVRLRPGRILKVLHSLP